MAARHVDVPAHRFFYLVFQVEEHPNSVEVGIVGREGMFGLYLAFDVANAPLHGRSGMIDPALGE